MKKNQNKIIRPKKINLKTNLSSNKIILRMDKIKSKNKRNCKRRKIKKKFKIKRKNSMYQVILNIFKNKIKKAKMMMKDRKSVV